MAGKQRTEYEIGIKDDTSRALAKIEAGFTKLNASALALGALGAGAAAGTFLAKSGVEAVNLADQLNKASQRTGVAVEALSQYYYAAELSDVSNESLNASLAKLARNMDAAAQGSKAQSAAFDAIGVSVKNTDGTLRATQEVFDDIAVAMGKLPDGATKTSLAMALVGRAGAELIPLWNANADGFAAVRKEADALGVTLSAQLAAKSEELKDNLAKLDKATDALGITLASKVVPSLADFTTEFVRAYTESDKFLTALDALGTTLSRVSRGSDKEVFGGLLKEEERLEAAIERLQESFNRGGEGKLLFGIKMDSLKKDLSEVRAQMEGLRTVMSPEDLGVEPPAGPKSNSAEEEKLRTEEARVRAALEATKASEARLRVEEKLRQSQAEYLADLDRQIALEGESSNEERVAWEIKFGKAKEFSKESKQAALELARQLDLLQDTAAVQEVLNGQVRQRAQLDQQAGDALAARRQEIVESLITPLEQYTASVKELLDLGFEGEQLQRGIEKYRTELEKADEAAKKLEDTGRELGLTFSSAVEEALVKWEGFGNFLEGLAEDIQRIFIRKTITEPLTDSLSKAFTNGLSGLFGAGGGGSTGGLVGGAWDGLFPNAAGGLYRVGGAGSEHPVAFTAKSGEYVAVGTKMETGGAGAPIINIYNQSPSEVNARRGADGRTIEVFVTSALESHVSRGGSRLGLKPPIATR